VPEADDTVSSLDDDTSRDATLVAYLHGQVVVVQNVRSLVTIIIDPLSTNYLWWCDMMLPALRRYALDDHVLINKIDDTTYWYHVIVLTWMLGILSVELQEIVREPSETTR
jgi:hypothetical protein